MIQTARFHDGSRKISKISEVLGLDEKGNSRVSDIFSFNQTGIGEDGKIIGKIVPAGNIPSFLNEFETAGIAVPEVLLNKSVENQNR